MDRFLGDLHIYENGKLRQLPGFSQITVWAIKNDREGNIWVATGKGFFEIRDEAIVAKYTTANGLGLTINGRGASLTAISGENVSSVIRINGGNITLNGLTVIGLGIHSRWSLLPRL